VTDTLPSGLPDFGPSFAHISGTVNADFSTTLTVAGNTYHFGPAVDAITTAPGANLVLSNSSCGGSPFSFDNPVILAGQGVGITSVTPNNGTQGQNLPVTVTDLNTHFVQGTTTADFGSGIIVNSVVVTSAVSMTANISIAGNAVVGARTVTVTTGTEVASLD
jgi:hypothetical protein